MLIIGGPSRSGSSSITHIASCCRLTISIGLVAITISILLGHFTAAKRGGRF